MLWGRCRGGCAVRGNGQERRAGPAMETTRPHPSKSGHATVNGLNYSYAVYATGEPLLLLHGGLGQIEMFGPNLTKLAQSRQVRLMSASFDLSLPRAISSGTFTAWGRP